MPKHVTINTQTGERTERDMTADELEKLARPAQDDAGVWIEMPASIARRMFTDDPLAPAD